MIIVDTITNHGRIKQIIEDYWNKENIKNIIDIRYVCEYNKNCNCIEIKGIRINNIFLTCNQLEKITGKSIIIDRW